MSKFEITPEMVSRFEDVDAKRKSNTFFCHHCKHDTKQELLFEKGELTEPQEIVFFDESGKRKESIWTIEGRIWKISQCKGCEKINLNVFARHSPFEYDVPIHHFPVKDVRPFPAWITHLNKNFTELFCEIYSALNAGSTRLPLMGARTLLDMFIVQKIGDAGTFKQKLRRLVEEKYISESAKELLEVALEYGNATIHRNYKATEDEINGVMDIIENILHSEALADKTKNLKRTIT